MRSSGLRWKKPSAKAVAVVVVAILTIVVLRTLSSSSGPEDVDPRVVVIEPSAVLALPTGADPRLILEGSEDSLAVGDFLTTWPDWEAENPHAPEGFLLKVKHSEVVDRVTTVEVEPASLFEVELEGQLDTEGLRFRSVELSSPEASAPGQVEDHVAEPVFARISPRTASGVPDQVGELAESLKRDFGCGGSAKIEVGGKVTTSLEPEVKLVWSRRGRIAVGVDYAAAWVKGTAKAKLRAEAEGDLRCEPDPIVLVAPRWRTVVVVGQVPVPVTISLPVELSAWARGEASGFAEARLRSHAVVGVRHEKGSDAELMAGFSSPTLDSEFSPEFKVAGSAEASVYPAVGVEAGWRVRGLGKLAAAAKLGVRGGIHVGYAAAEQTPMRTCVPVTIEASLTVHVVRKSLGPWAVTPYEKNLVCRPRDPQSEG